VAQAKPKRRSRKRRKAARAARVDAGGPARVTAESARRPERRDRQVETTAESLTAILTGRTYGEPPQSPFEPIPVSEVAIFAGAIGVVVGLASSSSAPLIVGIIVCALGVIEVTAREHFSGYRSHATLLAGIPAVAVGVAMIAAFRSSLARATLLVVVVPIFGGAFWLLRKRFQAARQARVVRPPSP
jgi:hypothetical protein